MRVGLAMAAVVVFLVGAGPARAQMAPLTATGCEEHQAWVDGDAKVVAARLPKGYTAITDNGAPLLFVRAERCDALEGAASTIADWGVVVETPDGGGCASGAPGAGSVKGDVPPACNWYTLGLLTDDARVVDWLRRQTPTIPIRQVADLNFRREDPDALGRASFHFATAGFALDDVSSVRPGEISLRGAYWFATPEGTVRMGISTDDLSGGHADSVVHAPPGSELATLMGATSRSSVEPYSDFGIIRAAHGVLRKQLIGPALPGEELDSFAGSCSVQGDVTFSPPATNQQAPTFYTYAAAGTCTGTLNGLAVRDTPVRMTQSGHADASCLHAQTFPPSTGTLALAGAELPYTLDFTSKATENDGTAYGNRSGSATMHSTFLTQRSSPTVVTDCGGSGAAKAPMDLSLRTNTPLVSSRPAAAAGSDGLRLAVRPRRARAGRRTAFTFRVSTAAGRPAPGAVVRFAGRRARTGPAGTARIVTVLRRRGPRVARASLAGLGEVRAQITVRR